MMDIATIGAAAAGIKTVIDLATDLGNTHTDNKVRDPLNDAAKKLGDAYATLFNMRDELFQLQDSNRLLQDEVKKHTDWQITTEDYQLDQCAGGAMVYKYTKEDKPNHYLCPNCFADQEKRVLQDMDCGTYKCIKCGNIFQVGISPNCEVIDSFDDF
jgi:hypothetical protein